MSAFDDTELDTDAAPASTLQRGATVGRFLVVEELGRGGMGIVYRAYDPDLNRAVALKVLGHAGDSERRQRRLLREAQAMARLSDPHVVAVHDVGTDRGRVFVAMELVEGTTLTRWLQTERPWTERLDALLAAARGLAAAHAAGIVHRDFKPDNVMVGHDGRVRVMDFGLARAALDDLESSGSIEGVDASTPREGDRSPRSRAATDASDVLEAASPAASPSAASAPASALETQAPAVADAPATATDTSKGRDLLAASLTVQGTVFGTPAFMSPEQFLGSDTDARTDQFSFCVALYIAMYGQRPFRGHSLSELVVAVSAGRIVEPPRRTQVPAAIRRAVLRGLSPARDDRWPDMPALITALQAARTGRRRLARGLTFVALPVAVGAITYGLSERVDDPCRDAATHLEGVWDPPTKAALAQTMDQVARSYGATTWRRVEQLVDAYADTWVQQREAACLATARGEQSGALLDLKVACLDRRLDAIGALTEVLAEADPNVVEHAVGVAEDLPALAPCTDVRALQQQGTHTPEAEIAERVETATRTLARVDTMIAAARYTQARDAAQQVVSLAQSLPWAPLEAQARRRLGEALLPLGERDAAHQQAEQAYFLARSVDDDETTIDAAILLVTIAGEDAERIDEGRQWAKHAAAEIERAGTEPQHAHLVSARGLLLDAAGEYEQAYRDHLRALEMYERVLDPEDTRLGESHNNLGNSLVYLGRLEEARGHLYDAVAQWERALGPEHPFVGTGLSNIGVVEIYLGHNEVALESLRRSLAIQRAAFGEVHEQIAVALNNIGTALDKLGDRPGAVESYEEALAVTRKLHGNEHPDVANFLHNLGTTYNTMGELERAAQCYREGLEIALKVLGPDHPVLVDYHLNVGIVARLQGDTPEAMRHHELALALAERTLGPDHIRTANARSQMAVLRIEQGQVDSAYALLLQAQRELQRQLGPRHGYTLFAECTLALAEQVRGQPHEALVRLERMLSHVEPGHFQPLSEARCRTLHTELLLQTQGDLTRARTSAQRALELYRELGSLPDRTAATESLLQSLP